MILCDVCEEKFSSRNKLFMHLRSKLCDGFDGNKNITTVCVRGDNSQKSYQDNFELVKHIAIVSEDEWYRVIIKPQELATMGQKGLTLLNSNEMLLPDAIQLNLKYKKAVPCHRLDKSTGGLVLCSKSKISESMIKLSFRNKLVSKKYIALAIGKIEPLKGIINSKMKNKNALTKYEVITYTNSTQYEFITTVLLYPITGRKHQLRKHLHSIGHPIVGDKRYSLGYNGPQSINVNANNNTGNMEINKDLLYLWSIGIEFPHPKDYYEFFLSKKTKIDNDMNINLNNVEAISSEPEKVIENITKNEDCAFEITKKCENIENNFLKTNFESEIIGNNKLKSISKKRKNKNQHTTTQNNKNEINKKNIIDEEIELEFGDEDESDSDSDKVEKLPDNVKKISIEIDEPFIFKIFRTYHEEKNFEI
jgi:23S rRNA-/tRNA-specific pseudouridylate synthase